MTGIPVGDEHIGVITPYNSQARKIRTLLRHQKVGANGVKVGSVEEFQGQVRLKKNRRSKYN